VPPESMRARPRFDAIAPVVVAMIASLVVGALAAWLLFASMASSSRQSIRWQLTGPPGALSGLTATTTMVLINLDQWPACHPYDEVGGNSASWLATPEITYTPSSVTITMYISDSFDPTTCHGWYDYWGQPIEIHLTQPLAGRALLDGSTSPPGARPYR
jgi:hypothetical protein